MYPAFAFKVLVKIEASLFVVHTFIMINYHYDKVLNFPLGKIDTV